VTWYFIDTQYHIAGKSNQNRKLFSLQINKYIRVVYRCTKLDQNADKPTTEVDGHLYPGLGQTV
jgi:hypothetical protein